MALWTPAEITTALWLDAADSDTLALDVANVDQWDDKSGNSRHGTATGTLRPTYVTEALNQKNVVRFSTSADQRIDFTEFTTTAFTYCLVWAPASGTSNKQVLCVDSNSYNYLQYSSAWHLGARSQTVAHATNTWAIKIGALNADAGLRWTDGTANTSDVGSSDTARLKFRYLGNSGSRGPQGDVAELIVLPYVVSDTDRQKIEGYLAWKWGLEANLPTGHPYEDAAPTTTPATSDYIADWLEPYNIGYESKIGSYQEPWLTISDYLTTGLIEPQSYGIENYLREPYRDVPPMVAYWWEFYEAAPELIRAWAEPYGAATERVSGWREPWLDSPEIFGFAAEPYPITQGWIINHHIEPYPLSEMSDFLPSWREPYAMTVGSSLYQRIERAN